MTDSGEMARLLNEYFTSVFTREPAGEVPSAEDKNPVSILDGVVFTEEEVAKRIAGLKTAASPGPDGISARLLQ